VKGRRTLSTIINLFLGVAIGFAIALLIGLIRVHAEGGKPLMSPRTFGNIKIWAQKPEVAEGTEVPSGFYQEANKMLWMTKDDTPFLMITQNEAGKIDRLHLLKNKDEPVLFMTSLNSPGKWGRATYSCGGGTGKPVGDALIDIDFDGRFDFNLVVDNEGRRVSRSIFTDGVWQKVDRCSIKQMKAAIGQTWYTFDPNTGSWQREQ